MSDLRLPDLNKVIIAGRLTHDPDLKYIASGRAVCRIRIANSRQYKGKDGERKEDSTYTDVTMWDKQAEFVGERLKKGRPVLVEGRLKSDMWDDKTTGQKRSKLEIAAQRVVPLDWDESQGGNQQGVTNKASRPMSAQNQSQPRQRDIEQPVPDDDLPF